jgi:hypothetical protein
VQGPFVLAVVAAGLAALGATRFRGRFAVQVAVC